MGIFHKKNIRTVFYFYYKTNAIRKLSFTSDKNIFLSQPKLIQAEHNDVQTCLYIANIYIYNNKPPCYHMKPIGDIA